MNPLNQTWALVGMSVLLVLLSASRTFAAETSNQDEIEQWLSMLPPRSRDAELSGPSLSFKKSCFQSREGFIASIMESNNPLTAAVVLHLVQISKYFGMTKKNIDTEGKSTHSLIAEATGNSDTIVDLETLYDRSEPTKYGAAFVQACQLTEKAMKMHKYHFNNRRKELGKAYQDIKISETICPFMSDVARVETICLTVDYEKRGFVKRIEE